jgi:hypothetical protein
MGSVSAGDASFALLGFNLNEPLGASDPGTVVPTGAAVTVNFTRSGMFPLRVQLSGATDQRWCVELGLATGPVTIPWNMFRTQCWATTGTPYGGQGLRAIEIVVPGATGGPTLFDMCLTDAEDD